MRKKELPTSQKRVVTLLSKHGPLTKREMAALGGLGWATAVKSVEELIKAGFIEFVGTVKNPPGTRGKHAETYDLSQDYPLAVGIDVEYRTTHASLMNIKGKVLAEAEYKTVQYPKHEDVVDFLSQVIGDFTGKYDIDLSSLAGIGIGIPGIGFPSRSPRNNLEKARELEVEFEETFGTSVKISQNTKAYTVFQKWLNSDHDYSDFLWVAIRTGVGTGIIHRGQLYLGAHGLAGEIGHMKVVPGGPPCRCGSTGCLETVVNERYLFEQYKTRVIGAKTWSGGGDITEVREGLKDLFDRCAAGEPLAKEVIHTAAGYLGHALATTATILDINAIVISGHFGPNGTVLIDPLRSIMLEECLPDIPLEISYAPFEPGGYVRGAALLVLKNFLVDVPGDSLA